MKEFIKNISFTGNEIKVILFILTAVTGGFGVKYYKQVFALNTEIVYDYSEMDKRFIELSSKAGKDVFIAENDSSLNSRDTSDNHAEKELTEKIRLSEDSLLQIKKINEGNPLPDTDTEIININTASIEELTDLPGIGESTAEKILKYREEKKGFKKKEDIMNVKGIGKKKFENIKNYIKTD